MDDWGMSGVNVALLRVMVEGKWLSRFQRGTCGHVTKVR